MHFYPRSLELRRTRPGFTLIELLVVIAIIALLSSLSLAAVGRSRVKAKGVVAMSNLKQFGIANQLYANQHKGKINSYYISTSDVDVKAPWYRTAAMILGKSVQQTQWADVLEVIPPLRDPNVPPYLVWGPNDYQWGVAYNTYMNPWPHNNGKVPFLDSFKSPSGTLFMTSGIFRFDESMASNASLVDMPTNGPRTGFYYSAGGKLPALFLDGHTELLEFPIDRSLINPDAT